MKAYTVDKKRALTAVGGIWQVPIKTQGLVVTKDVFIYSTSHDRDHRSNLYVVPSWKGRSSARRCAPVLFPQPEHVGRHCRLR